LRESAYPEAPREAPIELHECHFEAEAERFTCDEEIEKRVTLESVDSLVPNAKDVSEADVLRFVLENRQELRESGYVIPKRLVEEMEGGATSAHLAIKNSMSGGPSPAPSGG
jgi:hypothetical protein